MPHYWLKPRSQREKEIQDQAEAISSMFRMDLHPRTRRERFVSHSERIQRYMSIYYQHHDCPLKGRIKNSFDLKGEPVLEVRTSGKVFSSKLSLDKPLSLTIENIMKCAEAGEANIKISKMWRDKLSRGKLSLWNTQFSEKRRLYDICQQIQKDTQIIFRYEEIPILAHFGRILGKDMIDTSDGIPIFGDWRFAAPVMPLYDIDDFNDCRTPYLISDNGRNMNYHIYPPIIWKFYDPFHALKRDILGSRTAWESKQNSAIWITTENHFMTKRKAFGNASSLINIINVSKSQFSRGTESPCRDESLKNYNEINTKISDIYPLLIDNKDLPQISSLQSFKIIILDDLGIFMDPTFLWRVLWSSSILVMVPPTYTTWAMEELLVPWIHFVPLIANETSSDALLRAFNRCIAWIREHDQQANLISERASLFIYDLAFHPDASRDDIFIQKEILKRYMDFWI
jgi:hypothetical protein